MIISDPSICMDISIIIINWKSAHFVQRCLETIYRDMDTLESEIIVIDNASNDDCGTMLLHQYPHVRFIQSNDNLGFAEANNLAYMHSRGKTLLFLNPDTEIVGQAISTMHRLLWETANAGAIGCTLLNTDGSLQTSCIQAFPTILNQVLDTEAIRRRFPLLPLWGGRPLFERREIPVPVEVVSGACLMVKRQLFESVGHFSTEYFMYVEDVDLCYKIRTAGFIVYYTASASVVHHGGGSSKQRECNHFAAVVMREALFRFMMKYHGKLYGYLYRLAMSGVAFSRIILIVSIMGLLPRRPSRDVYKISLGKWINIFSWSLGFEGWARRLSNEPPLHEST